MPVASTFTPAKGQAAKVEKPKRTELYNNYATIGVGNYTNLLGEFYSNLEVSRTDNFGLYLLHNSSQGGIRDVALDNHYYDSELNLDYTSRKRNYTSRIDLGILHQLYNWYGLPPEIATDETILNAVAPEHSYLGARIGGNLTFDEATFEEVTAAYRYFGDDYSSVEHHLNAMSKLRFNVIDELVNAELSVDYVTGSFDQNLFSETDASLQYNNLNVGLNAGYQILRDDLMVNLGAGVYFATQNLAGKSSLYFYPDVTASYRLVDEMLIAFGGLEGSLLQNTYYKATQSNPFVEPSLVLAPTNQQINGYLGFKGRISEFLSYSLEGSYILENDKPLFVKQLASRYLSLEAPNGYDYNNAFTYLYDDIATAAFEASLKFTITGNFTLGISGSYFSYTTDQQAEAWNLPTFTASVSGNYQITDQWYLDTQLFLVGERNDQELFVDSSLNIPVSTFTTKTLDSYFDANVTLGYRFSDRLSFFVKGNNLAGETYEKWSDYPVLGLQVMGGATYKFNW